MVSILTGNIPVGFLSTDFHQRLTSLPVACERGGTPADKDNFTILMAELRHLFDASGHSFGLTFTAPSSFWYLQHFDLPGLLRSADWVNLMSYDLHGGATH